MDEAIKLLQIINSFTQNRITLEELWLTSNLKEPISKEKWAQDYYQAWLNLEIIYVMNRTQMEEINQNDAIELIATLGFMKEKLEFFLKNYIN